MRIDTETAWEKWESPIVQVAPLPEVDFVDTVPDGLSVQHDWRIFLDGKKTVEVANTNNVLLIELIRLLDGGTIETMKSERLKDVLEEAFYSKKLCNDIISRISQWLWESIQKLIESAISEKTILQAWPHTRNNRINTWKIDTIDEIYKPEILSVLEQIKKIQERIPDILYIAPFYLESKDDAMHLSELCLILDFWLEFPSHIWSLISRKDFDAASNLSYARKSFEIHFRHLLADVAIWYWDFTVNPKKNGHGVNQSAKRQLTKFHSLNAPKSFPFIRKYGSVKSEESLAYFEKILLLPPWAMRYLLLENTQQINPTIISFFKKHKAVVLPYLSNTSNALIEVLVDTFGKDKIQSYITRYSLDEEGKANTSITVKKTVPKNKTAHADIIPVSRSYIQFEWSKVKLTPTLPPGWKIEARIGRDWLWQWLIDWSITMTSEDIYSEKEVFFRSMRNDEISQTYETPPILIPSMLKYRSPEFAYLMRSSPTPKNEYFLRQVFLDNKSVKAKEVISNWNYPDTILLWISLDDWLTWTTYQSEDVLTIRDFHGWNVKLAFSPPWIEPLTWIKFTEYTLQKRVTDVIWFTTKKSHECIVLTHENQQIPEAKISVKEEDELPLALYDALEKGEYILEYIESWNIELTFTWEALKVYTLSYLWKKEEIVCPPDSMILQTFIILAQKELYDIFHKKITLEREKQVEVFSTKLKPVEYFLRKIWAFSLKFSHIDHLIGNTEVFSSLRNGPGFLGVSNFLNGKREILEWFKNALEKDGATVEIKRVSILPWNTITEHPRWMELSITLSLAWMMWTIYSLPTWNKYEIELDETMHPTSRKRFANLLINTLILLGVIWKYNPEESKSNKVTLQDISRRISWELIWITWLSLKEEKHFIQSAYERFKIWDGKICEEFGFSDELGCYMNIIHSRQGIESIRWEESDNFVVLVDEKLSSVPEGRHGQVEVYNLLHNNPRMQKYLVLRIRETILDDGYKWKSPFTGTMFDECMKFWNTLDESVRQDFINAMQSSTDAALSVKDSSGQSVIYELIEYWREKKVQIIYSRPHLIPTDEFMSIIESFDSKK
jgi:hypothetical protein